jgi:hypothetical protein
VNSCIWFNDEAEIPIRRIPKLTDINLRDKWGLKIK